MTAAIILVVSFVSLAMFFVTYCRSLTTSCRAHVLSKEVRDIAGISTTPSDGDFKRVVQLLQLVTGGTDYPAQVRTVALYYELLHFLQRSVVWFSPSLKSWAAQERTCCAYFAAVALDHQISVNRATFAG